MKRLRIAIIGITGSVGRQAVDVIRRNRDRFDIRLATAHRNAALLEQLGHELGAKKLILTQNGMGELLQTIDDIELDVALVAASGTDIISVAHKLASKGVKLALANKECIVSAGKFVTKAAKESGGMIIPVDSEHSALFQCMCGHRKEDIAGLVLTASGGAFRDLPKEALETVSIKDALTNPNWSMGQKITVDSATMMNKGLELIEARYLFDIEPDMLSVVIHPQSIVHSMVSYKDGAVLAQLGLPDMRVPIAYALGCAEERIDSGVAQLDFTKNLTLTFIPPDIEKYRCLDIAMKVLQKGSNAEMITMNATNEVAVAAFIDGKLSFNGIAELIEATLNAQDFAEPETIETVIELDSRAKMLANKILRDKLSGDLR